MFKPHLQLQPHLRVILSLANITGTVRYPIKYGTTPRLRIMVGGGGDPFVDAGQFLGLDYQVSTFYTKVEGRGKAARSWVRMSMATIFLMTSEKRLVQS